MFVIADGVTAGSIAMPDTIRPESYAAVKELQSRGIKRWMLPGEKQDKTMELLDRYRPAE